MGNCSRKKAELFALSLSNLIFFCYCIQVDSHEQTANKVAKGLRNSCIPCPHLYIPSNIESHRQAKMRSSPPPYPEDNYDLPQLPSQNENDSDSYTSALPDHLTRDRESDSKNEYQQCNFRCVKGLMVTRKCGGVHLW
jgi:hypothetical protein